MYQHFDTPEADPGQGFRSFTRLINSLSYEEIITNLSFDQAVNHTDFQYIYGQGTQNQRPETVAAAV
ncbi:hypothetical protein, partial [Pedobacter lusitanus]|uniref:hypothetical protein n=1 Tax=Pedobacter lusitanus TaxID=1503925 RepID=UPI001F2B3165